MPGSILWIGAKSICFVLTLGKELRISRSVELRGVKFGGVPFLVPQSSGVAGTGSVLGAEEV